MHRHLLAILTALPLCVSIGPGLASAQTSGMPDGAMLLQRAQSYLVRAGSVHVATEVDLSNPRRGRSEMLTSTDVGLRPRVINQDVYIRRTLPGRMPSVWTAHFALNAAHASARYNLGPVQCPPAAAVLNQAAGYMVAFGIRTQGARTIGATTFNGVPVWDVQVPQTLSILGVRRQVVDDVYVSQASGAMLGQVSDQTFTLHKLPLHERVLQFYLRYGAPFTARPAC